MLAPRLFGADGRSTGIICDQTISLDGFYDVRITPNFCGASASRTPSPATLASLDNFALPAAICALYESHWSGGTQLKASDQEFYGTVAPERAKRSFWSRLVAIVKKRLDLDARQLVTDPSVTEKAS